MRPYMSRLSAIQDASVNAGASSRRSREPRRCRSGHHERGSSHHPALDKWFLKGTPLGLRQRGNFALSALSLGFAVRTRPSEHGAREPQRQSGTKGAVRRRQKPRIMTQMEERERLRVVRLQRAIARSPGLRAEDTYMRLLVGVNIAKKNLEELRAALVRYQDSQFALWVWDEADRSRLTSFLAEVARLLHNYLAGAESLVHHLDTAAKREFGEPSLANDYLVEKRQLLDTPLGHFMRRLRNYSIHVGVPDAVARMTITAEAGMNSSVLLNLDKLKQWKGFEGKAGHFLSSLDASPDVLSLVNDHSEKVFGLSLWVLKRYVDGNRVGLEELGKFRRELHDIVERSEVARPRGLTEEKAP